MADAFFVQASTGFPGVPALRVLRNRPSSASRLASLTDALSPPCRSPSLLQWEELRASYPRAINAGRLM